MDLQDIARVIRSKNAGPRCTTLDIMFNTDEDYRRVIDLRFRRELPFDTIGDIMNRSKDSARMLLFRAVEKLQGELGIVHDAAARSRRE